METNNTLEKMTILDLYGQHIKLCHWLSPYEFETENYCHKFLTMSLHALTKVHYIGNICGGTQLIRKHKKNKYIVMFSPHLSSNKDGKNYGEFCKYELIKYKPYVGDIENTYIRCTDNIEFINL